jgi:hypothetical protein
MPVAEETRLLELPLDEPLVDPEALIAEARRRQRKRRLLIALIVAVCGVAAIGIYLSLSHTTTHPSGADNIAAIGKPATLQLHLRGFGTPLPAQIDQGPCPQGRTLIEVRPGQGSVVGCVLTISKWDAAYGVKQIRQTARETYRLAGGTIITHETQTIRFARDQRHTRATFSGRVIGGSGRYAHAHGSISGGGPGVGSRGEWTVSIQLSYR